MTFYEFITYSQPVGGVLPAEICELIRWLEAKDQVRRSRRTKKPFLPIYVDQSGQIWSQLMFVIPETEFVPNWLGRSDFPAQIFPFVRCGGDGSMLALWRMAGRPEHYVFMGSEGEAFVIAEDERALITLITMGYDDIIGRGSLEPTPAELWGEYNERPWPEPIELKQFTAREFGIDYPQRGADLLPYSEGDDPFESFCKDLMTN